MNASKTRCHACGASILQRTADKYDGLCAPCHRKAAAIPPSDFEIPRDLVDRIVSVNEDPADYREMAWRDGADFVYGFMDRLSERNDLYATWSPKLREFAAKCRTSNPAPAAAELPAREQGKLPIFDLKIRNAERLPGLDKNTAIFCCLPVIAIPIAQASWLGKDPRSVILTPEELAEWNNIYTHPEDTFWWFIHYWWDVEDPPKPKSIWMPAEELTVPTGTDPWLVTSGFQWGPLAGGVNEELWSWDGENAAFVRHVGRLVS